jgi:hypothetical protein
MEQLVGNSQQKGIIEAIYLAERAPDDLSLSDIHFQQGTHYRRKTLCAVYPVGRRKTAGTMQPFCPV